MSQEELIKELIELSNSKTIKRDIRTIGEELYEKVDHTLLTHMMCLLVENEKHIIDMLGEDDYAWRYESNKEKR